MQLNEHRAEPLSVLRMARQAVQRIVEAIRDLFLAGGSPNLPPPAAARLRPQRDSYTAWGHLPGYADATEQAGPSLDDHGNRPSPPRHLPRWRPKAATSPARTVNFAGSIMEETKVARSSHAKRRPLRRRPRAC